ncbi:hypothetical protein AX16_003688 [Volvariella volvacea WC 439]|nr:hypothetical protein AX16_003688 [Volvariella volvacea WC 439]
MASTSILVPVAYVVIVLGGLFTFSYFYRKQTAARITESYFPTHHERNTYITLLQKTDPPASDALLKSALVRRAMADVQRVIRIREDKPALQNLLQKGSIGDDLWNSLLSAEKELEAEIMEVVAEANSFVEGWGQVIFPTANEMIANEKMRSIFEQTPEIKAELEKKYGAKALNIPIPAPFPPGGPVPGPAAPGTPKRTGPAPVPATPENVRPSTPNSPKPSKSKTKKRK